MIVSRRLVPAISLLVALMAVTVFYTAGIAAAPKAFFGGREDVVLLLPTTGEVTSTGSVSMALRDALAARDDVGVVSAEIVVLTSVAGRSVFARGVEFDAFLSLEQGALLEGRAPTALREAIVGIGLATLLDIDVGDRVVVPGSLAEQAAELSLVGIFDAPGLARDELLISLPVARGLADLPPNGVHFVRAQTSEVATLQQLLSHVAPHFTYSDVRLTSQEVLEGEPLVLRANVTNWGLAAGQHHANLTADGRVIATTIVEVPGRSTLEIVIPIELTTPGAVVLSLNPTFEVSVRPARAAFEGIVGALALDRPTQVRLVDAEGAGVPGALVRLGNAHTTTGADGIALITPLELGQGRLSAFEDGRLIGTKEVFVAAREHLDVAASRPLRLEADAYLVSAREPLHLNVTLSNVGGVSGMVEAHVMVDGEVVAKPGAVLAPGGSAKIPIKLAPLRTGVHELTIAGLESIVSVEAVDGDPRVAAALRAREAAQQNPGVARIADPDAYIDRIVQNVAFAAAGVSVAATSLSALALLAVWTRQLEERARSIGVLKSLGATRAQVQAIVARAAALYAGIGSVVGLSIGLALTFALHASGLVRAFGHRVAPLVEPWLLLALAAVAISGNIVVARALAGRMYDKAADQLLRGSSVVTLPPRPPSLKDVLARESG